MTKDWLVIGAGRCGLHTARAMVARGLRVAAIVERSPAARRRARQALPEVPILREDAPLPAAGRLLIALPDDAIAAAAAQLAPLIGERRGIALHTSGSQPGAILAPLAPHGLALGSFHPLLSFPSPSAPAIELRGVLAAIEGAPAALAAARSLARRLGMRTRTLEPDEKVRYHAAAVIAANLTHALLAAACDELVALGFTRRDASRALAPLVASATEAALTARGWERLTGPLVRGDTATVTAHLSAMPADLRAAYAAVSRLAAGRAGNHGSASQQLLERLCKALTDPPYCASVEPMAPGEGH